MASDKFHRMGLGDLKQLYQGSVLRYANRPVYVNQILNPTTANITDLETMIDHNVVIDPRLFEALPRGLGYFNSTRFNGAVWVARTPARRFSLGLCPGSNVRINATWGGAADLRDSGVAHALWNDYPTWEEAVKKIERNERPVAVSPHFLLLVDKRIMFRQRVVVGALKDGEVKLSNRFTHIKELLELEYGKNR